LPVVLELPDRQQLARSHGGQSSHSLGSPATLSGALESPACSHIELVFDGDAASPGYGWSRSSRFIEPAEAPAAPPCQPALLPSALVAAAQEPRVAQQQAEGILELELHGQYADFLHQLLELDMSKPK
jgi:hypothetical protein